MRRVLAGIAIGLGLASPAAAAPKLESVSARTAAPGQVKLDIVASDSAAGLGGIRVERLDAAGRVATAACRVESGAFSAASGKWRGVPKPFRPGSVVPFALPLPGPPAKRADIRVTVTGGGCGSGPATVSGEYSLTPADLRSAPLVPVKGSAKKTPAAPAPRAVAAAAACDGADIEPTGRTRRLAREAVHCLLNAVRVAKGLRPLRGSKKLRRAALRHSLDMGRRGYFAHEGPGGPPLPLRLRAAGYRAVMAGENIGAGTGPLATPRAAVVAWMDSAPHLANILEPRFREIGIGVATVYPDPVSPGATYTTDFGRR